MLKLPSSDLSQRLKNQQALDDGVSDSDPLAWYEQATANNPVTVGAPAGSALVSPNGASAALNNRDATAVDTLEVVQAATTSPSVEIAPAVTVADGASVEIAGASAQSVTFTGTTGTLIAR